MDRAPDGWCLLTDIDHLLEARYADKLLDYSLILNDRCFFTFSRQWASGERLNSHPNSFLLQRELYWRIGGCDEDWAGWWGAGEQVFRKGINGMAAGDQLSLIFLTHYGRKDIPDASMSELEGETKIRKGSKYDYNNNPELVKKARGPAYKPVNPLRFSWERVL